MTWVKVCGLTTRSAVEAAVTAGADALGFVSYRRSPRHLSLDAIARLAGGISALRVLLIVDADVEEALGAVAKTGVDGIQPYGPHVDAVATAGLEAGLVVLRPLRAGPGLVAPTDGTIPLVDTVDSDLIGGTGRVFDWSVLGDFDGDFVLAGGLGPDNVAEAVRKVRPWGVDASSGLEQTPGVKDIGKVAAFVEEAKRT